MSDAKNMEARKKTEQDEISKTDSEDEDEEDQHEIQTLLDSANMDETSSEQIEITENYDEDNQITETEDEDDNNAGTSIMDKEEMEQELASIVQNQLVEKENTKKRSRKPRRLEGYEY